MADHIWHKVGLISDDLHTAHISEDGEVYVRIGGQPISVSQSGVFLVTPTAIEAVTSLNAVNATGAGSALDAGRIVSSATMYVTATGGPTIDVELQASLDNITWFDTGAAITVAGSTARANTHARYYRANLTVLTGGTLPTVTVHIATSF